MRPRVAAGILVAACAFAPLGTAGAEPGADGQEALANPASPGAPRPFVPGEFRAVRGIAPASAGSIGVGAGLPHHAAPPRYELPVPAGNARYERFKSAYLTPGGKAWIGAVYERSRPYSAYVRARLAYYDLPEEIFFLPFIESEYSVNAVSRSGATGLWQFMRNSIGGYGIRVTDWIDERRDFMKSTDAALRKLAWNRERFGDWFLALAAYNCGAGAMERAIAAGGVRDYWALSAGGFLPPETVSYVPKFMAVVAVAKYAGRNGVKLSWEPGIEWETIPLDRPVDLGMLAKAAGARPEDLRSGNGELLYSITPPEGGYDLKVPAAEAPAFREALSRSDVELMRFYLYKVGSGDTLSALARHYEVSVPMIVRYNPGMKPEFIRIGQKIVIPALKDKAPYGGVAPAVESLPFTGSYVVRKGDTLWSISLLYGVRPESLAERNGLDIASVIREGSVMNVPILN